MAGPTLATLAIVEAFTRKKIQEQLAQSEKRAQTVQTYMEPPVLQTSEGIIK